MKIMFIGDLHIGKKPSHSTRQSANRHHLLVDKAFHTLAYDEACDVVVQQGDVFDRYSVTDSDFVRAWGMSNLTDYVLRGNHDYAQDTHNVSALENLAGNSTAEVILEPTVVDAGSPSTRLHFIPYMPTQAEFLKALSELKPVKGCVNILCLHTNMYADGFKTAEVENNLSKSLAEELAKDFDLIVSGHEHNWSIKSQVHMVGSVMPCSFGDMTDKYGLTFDTQTLKTEWVEVWSAQLRYKEVSADEFLAVKDNTRAHYIEITGEVNPEQVLPVAKHMRRLFQASQVVSIKNSVKVRRSESSAMDEVADSMSWKTFVANQLNPAQSRLFEEMCNDY